MVTKRFQPLNSFPPPKKSPRFNEVVVLDGNELDRFAHHTLLLAVGMAKKVSVFSSPEPLLDRLASAVSLDQIPELLLTELHFTSMDGFAFLKAFSGLSDFVRNRCKIAIVTNSTSAEDRIRAINDSHVVRYFTKPLDLFQLKEFITPSN